MTSVRTVRETPTDAPVPVLELAEWRAAYGVAAGITTRGDNFNLGLLSEAAAGTVVGHWRTFLEAHRPGFPGAVVAFQVHGSRVARHESPVRGLLLQEGVDGHSTRQGGVLLSVTVADCVPVYLLHPRSGAMAMLHAGWRGVAAGVLEEGLAGLRALTDAHVLEFVMHCGVSICGDCYEVGPEVIQAVNGGSTGGAGRLDLRHVLAARALTLGVRQVSVSPFCTAHDSQLFFSHRRSAGQDGRMVAYLGRPLD